MAINSMTWAALGGGGIAQSMGMGKMSAAQEAAASKDAGLIGSVGGTNIGLSNDASRLQNSAMQQQIEQRRKLFELLTGSGGLLGIGLGTAGGSQADLLAQITASGEGQRSRITQDFKNAQGTALASLQQRGWSGSNLTPATLGSLTGAKSQAMSDLESGLMGQRVSVQEHAADRNAQIMQSLLGILG